MTSAESAGASGTGPSGAAPSAAARAALDRRLAHEQAERRLPSIVAGLTHDGALSWSGAAGRVDGRVPDLDMQYRCGSITKTFVAVQVMRLRDEGRLELNDPLERFLPGAFDGVTIAQLLSHSAGLRAETAGPWWERTAGGSFEELVEASLQPHDHRPAGRHPARLTRPGRRFHYSNVGFAILGRLVADLRGAPWPQTLREEVLDPLGMTRTTIRPVAPAAPGLAVHPFADLVHAEPEHDHAAMAPAGQLWTTIGDLARWMTFLAGTESRDPMVTPGRAAAAAAVLSPATLAEMREPLAVDDRRDQPWTGAHGLGLQVWNADGVRSYGHGGSMPGFLAILRIDATSGDGTVVMANSTAGLRPEIAGDLLRIYRDELHAPVAAWAPSAPDAGVLDALGRWFWGPSAYTLRAVGADELSFEPDPGGGRASRFVDGRAGGTEWTGVDGYFAGETLRIERDAAGFVRQLDLASFIFTRTPYDPRAAVPGGIDARGWHAP